MPPTTDINILIEFETRETGLLIDRVKHSDLKNFMKDSTSFAPNSIKSRSIAVRKKSVTGLPKCSSFRKYGTSTNVSSDKNNRKETNVYEIWNVPGMSLNARVCVAGKTAQHEQIGRAGARSSL